MAVILLDRGNCRIIEGNNDISMVRGLDIRIRPDEIITANIELLPEQIFVEVGRIYTEINGIKYILSRVENENEQDEGLFWRYEIVLIDAADYKGEAKLIHLNGDTFHVLIEGMEGIFYYQRNQVKKIVGDA